MSQYFPIVFISGIMCNEKLWENQLRMLPKELKVIVPNVIQDKSVVALASEIIQIANNKFNVVGFSSGGYIAQEIIRQNPEIVNKLILMNTAGGEYSKKQQITRDEFLKTCKSQGAKKALDMFIDKAKSTYARGEDNISDYICKIMREVDENMFSVQFGHVYAYNENAPLLSNIKCSTLIVVSDDDPFISRESYEEMLTNIPQAKLELIHGGGHMLPIARPDIVNNIIESFFDIKNY